MTDQLPDDQPSRIPPEHPTDPPDEPQIEAEPKPVAETGGLRQGVKLTSVRAAGCLSS